MKKSLVAACALLSACGGMQGEPVVDERITPLEQACVREPFNPKNWEQLAAALAIAGERERAATMYLQAASLRAHDVRQDYLTVKQARDEAISTMPRTQVRRIGPALVEVSRLALTETASDPVQAQPVVRLEISNGNGVTGAAARLARTLEADGVKTVRLSNLRPFVVPISRIEYPRGQQVMAQALGRRLGLPLQQRQGGTAYAEMRIVLGHDVRYLK